MEYEKPELYFGGSAVDLTQKNSCAKNQVHADCSNNSGIGTPTAYEADE
jgi:hypothetical protein